MLSVQMLLMKTVLKRAETSNSVQHALYDAYVFLTLNFKEFLKTQKLILNIEASLSKKMGQK